MDRGAERAIVHGEAKELDITERLNKRHPVVKKTCLVCLMQCCLNS